MRSGGLPKFNMCGRYANGLTLSQYRSAVQEQLDFDLDVDEELGGNDDPPASERTELRGSHYGNSGSSVADEQHSSTEGTGRRRHTYRPSFNVAPQTFNPVIRSSQTPSRLQTDAEIAPTSSASGKAAALMQPMKWGLIPRSAKVYPSGPDAYRTINARDDTALSGKSMWTPLLPAQRCVVFVQGFYEWQKNATGGRVAHFVGMADAGKGRADAKGKEKRLMPIAGLWERTQLHDPPEEVYSFTILTTHSNTQLEFLHDRMPVILPDKQAIATWLGLGPQSGKGGLTDDVARLIRPYAESLEVYKCPPDVGKVGNDSAQFILPVSVRKDGILAAFGRAAQKQQKQEEGTHQHHEQLSPSSAGKENGRQGDDISTNTETNAPLPEASSSTSPVKRAASPQPEGEETSKRAKGEPSSRFSPDPYNPPISPPRPHGGYSREGVSIKTPNSAAMSPDQRAKATAGSVSIESAFQKQKADQARTNPSPQPKASHQSPKSPSGSSKKTTTASPKNKPSGTPDIRSFFGKS